MKGEERKLSKEEAGDYELFVLKHTRLNFRLHKGPEPLELGDNSFYHYCVSYTPSIRDIKVGERDITKCGSLVECDSRLYHIILLGYEGPFLRREGKWPEDFAPTHKIISGYAYETYADMLSTFRC